MAGVAVGGAAMLATSPSATAFNPDLVTHGKAKKDDCFVTGMLAVPDFDVDVQILVAFEDLAAGVEAYVNLSCATPRESDAPAIVTLSTEQAELAVPLAAVYPDLATIFSDIFTGRPLGGKADSHKLGHKAEDRLHYVYEGTATYIIATGEDPFELEARTDALLAQDAVPVEVNGTTGTLEVRRTLIQGVIGAP